MLSAQKMGENYKTSHSKVMRFRNGLSVPHSLRRRGHVSAQRVTLLEGWSA
jgi:hypothetical protein